MYVRVWSCENDDCLSLCVGPVMNLWPVHGVPFLLPYVSLNRLQHSHDPEAMFTLEAFHSSHITLKLMAVFLWIF